MINDQLILDQMTIVQMNIDQMNIDQMNIDRMNIDRLSIDRMIIDCRRQMLIYINKNLESDNKNEPNIKKIKLEALIIPLIRL